MKTLSSLLIVLALAVGAWAQGPSTNAPQFSVNMNFLAGTPYGQSSAISNAFTTQFTTNTLLRADVIVMPGAGYSGYFGGPQYNLAAACPLLATTSLNCGKFMPYVNGAVGLGTVSVGGVTNKEIAGLVRTGANYDVTGTGKFSLNLYECGWGRFGHGANSSWFCQTGFSLGLGTNSAATQAKAMRIQKSNAKKLQKLQAAINKANKG
jgi:hypothetical protein